MRSSIGNQSAVCAERTGHHAAQNVDSRQHQAMTQTAGPEGDPTSGRRGTIADWLNLSHELRTPANAILGSVELIISGAMGPLSSDIRASLGKIQRASLDLNAQIAKAIDVGQGLPSSSSFPVDVIDLVDQLSKMWSQAQRPSTTMTRSNHLETRDDLPTCWLHVIAFTLHELGAMPSDQCRQHETLCDINHTHSPELLYVLPKSDRAACSRSVAVIETAIGMTGGKLEHIPGQLLLFWPTRES